MTKLMQSHEGVTMSLSSFWQVFGVILSSVGELVNRNPSSSRVTTRRGPFQASHEVHVVLLSLAQAQGTSFILIYHCKTDSLQKSGQLLAFIPPETIMSAVSI